MAKNLKLNIKNTQLAEALKLGKFKTEPAPVKKKAEESTPAKASVAPAQAQPAAQPAAKDAQPVAAIKKPVENTSSGPAPFKPIAQVKEKSLSSFTPTQTKTPSVGPIKPSSPATAATPRSAEPAAEKPASSSAATAKPTEEPPKKPVVFKDFKDLKTAKKVDVRKTFDSRDKLGLRASDDEAWRKKRNFKQKGIQHKEDLTIRPKKLNIRLPITIKDLAVEMKLKASQLVAKLFMQGIILTLNDLLDDPTTVQLLGHEFECEIAIDTTEERRIQITEKTIKEEIAENDPSTLHLRPPVATFMGHVDHGKTSLIDAIRKTNVVAGEAGAITQHIGAFKCHTEAGDLTVLDTPGHEAFSAMRSRGAEVTDIVVLVIAGDEGIREQTKDAIQKAKEAKVPILVALNKCDKPAFNADNVYRQLAEQELLPEAWGGTIITVNCSATTGKGIKELLEMLALQAEILELRANPTTRARGAVIESAMHKGLGPVATVLVQNGTLKLGDCVVFDLHWGRVKTMQDEFDKHLKEAAPSTPVKITGLSGLPEAGSEFIVVSSEKEAKDISAVRQEQHKHRLQQKVKKSQLENFLQKKGDTIEKKILNLILRADVQGSLEALKQSLLQIASKKVEVQVISENVGRISESDVELAAASKATIIGFHTQIESHAESLIRQKHVTVKEHDIIYHAIEDVKSLMVGLLDKIPQETDTGTAIVKAVFKSSQVGQIAGCMVTEGLIKRQHHVRVIRNKEVIWKGTISSLKRVKDDVREISKGYECGILLNHFSDYKEGDILQAYEITYLEPEL